MATAERFWAKVNAVPPVGCWPWTGACNADGYGQMKVSGRVVGAHRIAYELQVGPVPGGLSVLHSCDNPPCVRGAHLLLGTQTDNVRDMFAKGRANSATGDRNGSRRHPERRPHLRGESCGHAKLTWDAVREIRRRYQPRRVSLAKLAKDYGVSTGAVQQVIEARTWKE